MPKDWNTRGPESGLQAQERRRFLAFVDGKLRSSVLTLMLGMPALLLIGWMHDWITLGAAAVASLPMRALVAGLLLAIALLFRQPGMRRWCNPLAIAYLFVFGTAILQTTLNQPERVNLLHVVTVLMLIVWLRFALDSISIAATVTVLCLPLMGVLWLLHAPLAQWVAFGAYCLVGVWIGMASRKAHLQAWMEIYQLRRSLLSQLHEDSLTGIPNRDAWRADSDRVYQATVDAGQAISVLYFDIDQFKSINDRHGHASGDAILQAVAATLQRNLRAGELVARIGGEEFVALLPGALCDDAERVAERIRSDVENMDGGIPVTISAGIAQAMPGESLDALTARADKALLEAKRNGRNRVAASDPETRVAVERALATATPR